MKYAVFIAFLLLLVPISVRAGIAENLSGRILLDVERNGEAWYVYPEDNKRYYLGRPHDAFAIMRELGLGITELDFQKIPQAGMEVKGDQTITRRLAGRIVLQVEKNGEAWYINPVDLKKYYLGRPADAFAIMRELGLGISRKNLALVHKDGYDESVDRYSSYEYRKEVKTSIGSFFVDILKIDLNDPNLEIITDTATDYSCDSNCPARPLSDYVFDNDGFAGINGSYFNESNSKKNYYFAPVYRTNDGIMINDDQFKYWTTGPIIAFDENNRFYYFKDSRDFPDKNGTDRAEAFQEKYGVKLQALISNKPRLVENGMNALIEWDMDEKQKNVRSNRIALGHKEVFGNGMIYIVISRNATLNELAETMKALGVKYAFNLDGGYSTAMIYNDEYMAGPGRDVPNAIVFKKMLNAK
jgi:exopolysaccharide biosynthesis protein